MSLNAAIRRALPKDTNELDAAALALIIEASVRDYLRSRAEPYDAKRDTMNMRLQSLDRYQQRVYEVLDGVYAAMITRERENRTRVQDAAPFSTSRERDWAFAGAYEQCAELVRVAMVTLFPEVHGKRIGKANGLD